jgi:DNA-binding FadR family transcriptional regulator
MSLPQPGRTANSERELAELMKAIRKRDGAAARKASMTHITKTAQAALGMLQTREAEAPEATPSKKRA